MPATCRQMATQHRQRYPSLLPVRQRLFLQPIDDVYAAARAAFDAAVPDGSIGEGGHIAITAGSRGIANVDVITKAAVDAVRARGGEPFVAPAMGSHGGATDEGQRELLARSFGIEERSMGCPVRSSMKVVELGRTPEHDMPVYVDEHVARADGVVVINRVKAHTDYRGPYESGLFKMICIGMGKREQAEVVHAHGVWGLRELIPEVARAKLRLAPILGGLAIVEDGLDQTTEIAGLRAGQIEAEEPALLERSKGYLARLPFDEVDLLIVDQMGKEISGTGMDTNVIGRRRVEGYPDWESPVIERIIVRELTPEAKGNGVGIGLADVITRRLYEKVDVKTTQINGLTSTFALRLLVPVVGETDREAVDHALYLLRRKPVAELRVARISDTMHLAKLLVSPPLLDQARDRAALEPEGEPEELRFDGDGQLVPDKIMT